MRKALESSPSIAQGIVIEVKVTFMIVEGVVLGLVLSGLSVLLMCGGEGNKVPKRGRMCVLFARARCVHYKSLNLLCIVYGEEPGAAGFSGAVNLGRATPLPDPVRVESGGRRIQKREA